MYYLSPENLARINNFSIRMLAKNGWADQFTITKKMLNKYSSAIDNLAVNRTADELVKNIADVLIVSAHLVNALDITDDELNAAKIAKLNRTYTNVLKIDYAGENLQTAAAAVLAHSRAAMGNLIGSKYQLYIASEEAGELAKEISKYQRHALTFDTDKLATDRQNIVEELFDTLYTISYVMLVANITTDNINEFATRRIAQIEERENENKLG